MIVGFHFLVQSGTMCGSNHDGLQRVNSAHEQRNTQPFPGLIIIFWFRVAGKTATTFLSVHSYNVLAPQFARPLQFTRVFDGYLASSYRLGGVKAKLTRSVEERAVVCLQEVSNEWIEPLQRFFEENNFQWICSISPTTALPGVSRREPMGVAIAVPLDTFSLVSYEVTRVVDTKLYEFHSPWRSYLQRLSASPRGALALVDTQSTPSLPGSTEGRMAWNMALQRGNKMVLTRLRSKGVPDAQDVYVGTYHMPCLYQTPPVMVIHAALCAQHIQRTAAGCPYVLAGDFNIKPSSSMYTLLTTGKMEGTHTDHPIRLSCDPWTPRLREGMGSAYANVQGAEPSYTNFPGIRQHFKETLDYVFYSPTSLAPTQVLPLPSSQESRVLPSSSEPSDHLMIGASFSIVKDKG